MKRKKNEEEECATYIREKNKAKETRTNYGEYQEWRRETKRIYKIKKRENMKKQLEEINQLNQQNERRKFYKPVDSMKRDLE